MLRYTKHLCNMCVCWGGSCVVESSSKALPFPTLATHTHACSHPCEHVSILMHAQCSQRLTVCQHEHQNVTHGMRATVSSTQNLGMGLLSYTTSRRKHSCRPVCVCDCVYVRARVGLLVSSYYTSHPAGSTALHEVCVCACVCACCFCPCG